VRRDMPDLWILLRSLRDSASGWFTAFLVAAAAADGVHSSLYTMSVRSTILR
jgi:hypothetical protein